MKYLLLIGFLLLLYAFLVEPNILTIKHVRIKNEKLNGLKIVFATDFHFKPYEKYRLKRIVRAINKQNADIILLGGDYVNGHKKGANLDVNIIAKEFSDMKSKNGTFAVMGNHDGWQGRHEIIDLFEKNGIEVLENRCKNFEKFTIAGVEDLQTANPDIEKALKEAEQPVILLSHTPDIISEVPDGTVLTLAGHTHGGQVVFHKPITVPSKYGTKYAYGLFATDCGKMFVSKGLGTSILPLRFNCLPEIVVIEFE